jgi:hypothetical protein
VVVRRPPKLIAASTPIRSRKQIGVYELRLARLLARRPAGASCCTPTGVVDGHRGDGAGVVGRGTLSRCAGRPCNDVPVIGFTRRGHARRPRQGPRPSLTPPLRGCAGGGLTAQSARNIDRRSRSAAMASLEKAACDGVPAPPAKSSGYSTSPSTPLLVGAWPSVIKYRESRCASSLSEGPPPARGPSPRSGTCMPVRPSDAAEARRMLVASRGPATHARTRGTAPFVQQVDGGRPRATERPRQGTTPAYHLGIGGCGRMLRHTGSIPRAGDQAGAVLGAPRSVA